MKKVTLGDDLRNAGISLLYVFDRDEPRAGGYTLAYRKATKFKSGKMVDLAVSYCSIGDSFDRKLGRELALNNLYNEKYIQVPALMYGEEYVHDFLRKMFRGRIYN